MSLLDKTNLLITPNAVKAGKLYSVIPSNGTGDCTVVRNTTATRFNSSMILVSSAANTPRINYLTVNGNPFILDEPQRTNILPQSESLNNASFFSTSAAVITAVSILNPANSLASFDYRLNNVTTDGQFIRLNPNAVYASGVTQTYSIFVKYGSFRFCKISFVNFSIATYAVAVFDLINGVVGTTSAVGAGSVVNNSSIQSLQNGWFRISISATLNSNPGNSMNFEFNKVSSASPTFSNSGRESQTTTTADFCYLNMAQLEAGFLPSSYIPTSGSAVTRNADVITVAPPAGTVKITTTFSNDTTQVLTTIPATFTLPEGLSKQVLMQNSL